MNKLFNSGFIPFCVKPEILINTPIPPLGRTKKEGVSKICDKCGSTMSKDGFLGLFGKRSCDNWECRRPKTKPRLKNGDLKIMTNKNKRTEPKISIVKDIETNEFIMAIKYDDYKKYLENKKT